MDQVQISLLVACSGLDADGVADLTAELRREILNTDVDSAELAAAGEAPEGAKSGAWSQPVRWLSRWRRRWWRA